MQAQLQPQVQPQVQPQKRKKRKLIDRGFLGLTRSGLTMAIWGLVLLGAGIIGQYVSLPYPHGYIVMWLGFTAIGLAFQAHCQLRYEPVNYYVWVGAMIIGWAFTLYVVYSNAAFYSEIAPVWFLLLAAAYAHTGWKIDPRYYILAVIHLLAAIVFEIAWRQIWGVNSMDFLIYYGTIWFGLISGIGLLVGAVLPRGRWRKKTPPAAQAPAKTI